jgi:glycosyltransferase involved in cell wall biosynthesis
MKVYFNRKPKLGPWGGGTKTVNSLMDLLIQNNHLVTYDLNENDIDIIFCFDPRPNIDGIWYQHFLNYKSMHPQVKIIQRVGDVGTHNKPELTNLVKQTVHYSDHIIFPSEWAKEYIGYNGTNYSVIHNRPMKQFHSNKRMNDLGDVINIVTHHWSTNPKKGFDIYEKIDKFCGLDNKFSFTYIGRKPDNLTFKSSNYIEPKDAEFLANELPKYDIYLTASIEEAGANHVLEALAAGLPVIYHIDGGSIIEYCNEYGVSYENFDDLINGINYLVENFYDVKTSVLKYNDSIGKTIEEYYTIICNVK